MADLTTLSTFTRFVQGNKSVVYADVPGGGSTADSIVPPHLTAVDFVSGCFRSSVVAASSVAIGLGFEGTTVNIFRIAATTGAAFRLKIEGR